MTAGKIILYVSAVIAVLALVWTFLIAPFMGDGAFKRLTTVGGVYVVCKPDGYPMICGLDADSDQGGLSCIPYAGECHK